MDRSGLLSQIRLLPVRDVFFSALQTVKNRLQGTVNSVPLEAELEVELLDPLELVERLELNPEPEIPLPEVELVLSPLQDAFKSVELPVLSEPVVPDELFELLEVPPVLELVEFSVSS